MAKPKAITWLEDQTGQRIDYTPDPTRPDRHLSVRLTGDLAADVAEVRRRLAG